jgi:heat shock protein HslJ
MSVHEGDRERQPSSRVSHPRGRTAIGIVALGLGLGLLLGCSFAQPAHQIQLDESSWVVQSIGGVATLSESRPRIVFDQPVSIDTGCRSLLLSWDMDTDGSALVFETPTASKSPCDGDLGLQDAHLLKAIGDVTSWSVIDSSRISLRGGDEIVLERDRDAE